MQSSHKYKELSPLPSEYTAVKDLFRHRPKSEKLWAPLCNVNFSDITDFQELHSRFSYEITWLEQGFDSLQNYSTNDETTCNGWAAHHASENWGIKYPPRINTITPLIWDKVATLNTQGHCTLGNIKCNKIINPDQTPVDCTDQPIFTLTKKLQFRFPKMFQNYFPLFVALHIKHSLLVLLGQLFKGSGLMEILNLKTFNYWFVGGCRCN